MGKFAEKLIIQAKTLLPATLFIYIFILPWIYHFCGPRKIIATCLEGGYHLDTSNVLFTSGEEAHSHSNISAEDAQGAICLYSRQKKKKIK